LRYHLGDEAYNAVADIFVFGLEAFEEVLEQAISKARCGSLIVILHLVCLAFGG
jgi:hypothetical protein